MLLVLAPVALVVDLPVAAWLSSLSLHPEVKEIFTVVETFGHGLGVALILLVIWVLTPEYRYRVPQLLAASIGAGLASNLVKMLISRQRPRAFDLSSTSVMETFGTVLPALRAGPGGQSFPSAHSATAVGFAVALAICFPRGKRLFAALAALTCVSRMYVEAHFLSDVLVGASVGLLIGQRVMQWKVQVPAYSLSDQDATIDEATINNAENRHKRAA